MVLSKHEMVVDKDDWETLNERLKKLEEIISKLPNEDNLKDLAYRIATGNCTTREMNSEAWSKCDLGEVLWEQFEDLGEDFTKSQVESIAYDIINNLKPLLHPDSLSREESETPKIPKRTFDSFDVHRGSQLLTEYLEQGEQEEYLTDMDAFVAYLEDYGTEDEMKQLEKLNVTCDCCHLVRAF